MITSTNHIDSTCLLCIISLVRVVVRVAAKLLVSSLATLCVVVVRGPQVHGVLHEVRRMVYFGDLQLHLTVPFERLEEGEKSPVQRGIRIEVRLAWNRVQGLGAPVFFLI